MSITAHSSGIDLGVDVWKFPCGEVGVKLKFAIKLVLQGEHVCIKLQWEGSDDIMALAQLVDVVKAAGASSWSLDIPYFPYSRQDRRCAPGEAHSLKVFCNILNSLGFSAVKTLDAHSHVLDALVENIEIVPQCMCAHGLPLHDVLIAPDAGAEKKVYTHAQVNPLHNEDRTDVICASKFRDSNGNIAGVRLLADETAVEGKRVCIVDDLCDGGATFLSVGKAVLDYNPDQLNLYVTHGMFTKGYEELFSVFDNIYTHHHWKLAPSVPERYNTRFHLI